METQYPHTMEYYSAVKRGEKKRNLKHDEQRKGYCREAGGTEMEGKGRECGDEGERALLLVKPCKLTWMFEASSQMNVLEGTASLTSSTFT